MHKQTKHTQVVERAGNGPFRSQAGGMGDSGCPGPRAAGEGDGLLSRCLGHSTIKDGDVLNSCCLQPSAFGDSDGLVSVSVATASASTFGGDVGLSRVLDVETGFGDDEMVGSGAGEGVLERTGEGNSGAERDDEWDGIW